MVSYSSAVVLSFSTSVRRHFVLPLDRLLECGPSDCSSIGSGNENLLFCSRRRERPPDDEWPVILLTTSRILSLHKTTTTTTILDMVLPFVGLSLPVDALLFSPINWLSTISCPIPFTFQLIHSSAVSHSPLKSVPIYYSITTTSMTGIQLTICH